jgi:thiol:disulfide interchange protein DsbD
MRPHRFTLLAAGLLLAADAEAQPKPGKTAHVTLQAFADRQAIAPGDTFNLAVSLKIDDDWHIYWRSPGGPTGIPTTIEWSGPEGTRFGRTQYPIPELIYDKELKEDAYILSGSPVFVTPVSVPGSVKPGSRAAFRLKAGWLVCRKECIPGEASLELTLPVVRAGHPRMAANADRFESARESFPVAADKAEYLKIAAVAPTAPLLPGKTASAGLTIRLSAGNHMQSNKPLIEGLIPAVLFLEQADGLEFGPAAWPAPHIREVKDLGRLSEFSGTITPTFPITVDPDAGPAPRWARGILQYQICSDAGTCYPPSHVEFAIPLRMAGGPAPPAAPEDWAAAPPVESARPAPPTAAPPDVRPGESDSAINRLQDWLLSFGYFGALALAFLGGLALNVMPCVLPVISLKVLSFVRQSHEDRGRIFRLGLTYSAGILSFFGVLAAFFSLGGQGWGQLFQNPRVVLGLAAVVTAFAMSLFGVWALFTPRVINQLGAKAEGEGYSSAFFTGVLATFLGTACTAPFLSAALGAASRFTAPQGAGIFLGIGLGMALPFVLLAANPAWLRFVPRPGPWMSTFEAGMGFFLLGTVIWLLNPLRGQLGDYGLLLSLIFLLTVAAAAWVKGRIGFTDPPARRARLYALAGALLLAGWVLPFRAMSTIDELVDEQIRRQDWLDAGQRALAGGPPAALVDAPDWSRERIEWRRYKRARALATVSAGYTVFVDYTADWCANCKTMLKTAIEQPETIRAMKELNVVPYTADYTLPVPEIKEDLARFKRGGVPVFVVYRPGDTERPEILPEIITTQSLVDALRRAGPSRPNLSARLGS